MTRRFLGWECIGPGNWGHGEYRLGFYEDVPSGWWLTGPDIERRLGDWFDPAIREANTILAIGVEET